MLDRGASIFILYLTILVAIVAIALVYEYRRKKVPEWKIQAIVDRERAQANSQARHEEFVKRKKKEAREIRCDCGTRGKVPTITPRLNLSTDRYNVVDYDTPNNLWRCSGRCNRWVCENCSLDRRCKECRGY
jgi:hypothetical protein